MVSGAPKGAVEPRLRTTALVILRNNISQNDFKKFIRLDSFEKGKISFLNPGRTTVVYQNIAIKSYMFIVAF